jgi:hypothetical protein
MTRAWRDPDGQLWVEVTPGHALCVDPLREVMAENFSRGAPVMEAGPVFGLRELVPAEGRLSIVPGNRALLEQLLAETGWRPDEGDVVRAAADGYEVEWRAGTWVPRAG